MQATGINQQIERFNRVITEMGFKPGDVRIVVEDLPGISNETLRDYAEKKGFQLVDTPMHIADVYANADKSSFVVVPNVEPDECPSLDHGCIRQGFIKTFGDDTAEARLRVFLELREIEDKSYR